ncbi:MAG: hypothetical protein H6707_03240 [Deltaproteobacteria bacterium]|nr:hypothetical protein [Deltaproteobacteria bacterium]
MLHPLDDAGRRQPKTNGGRLPNVSGKTPTWLDSPLESNASGMLVVIEVALLDELIQGHLVEISGATSIAACQ